MGWHGLYYVFSKSFSWLDSWESFEASLYTLSLQFWQRKDQGFAALFEIPVVICVDGVFLSCTCKFFYLYNFPTLLFCKLGKWSVKVEFMVCYALPLSFLNIYVFFYLKRTLESFLLSLAPHRSFLSIHLIQRHQDNLLPCPKKNSAKTVSHPRTQNCCAQFSTKTLKI